MTNDKLLQQLFQPPESTKLRKPLFGRAKPSDPKRIVELNAQHADTGAPRPPFEMRWTDDALGVTVDVLESADGELMAYVTCTGPGRPGQAASVALLGSFEDRLLRKTILLDNKGCGNASFGQLKGVREELGDELRLSAYLLE